MTYNLKSMKGEKVLITGGIGLVGSNVARKCLELGAEVTIFNKNFDKIKNIEDIKSRVKIIRGDIMDYEKIEESIFGMDYIFLFAGQVSHLKSMKNPFLDLNANCKATLNVLESCRKHNPDAKIIFSGTVREAGVISGKYVDETQREEPTSIYGLHKLTSEKYLQIYNKVYGLKTTTLRLTNVFGIGTYNTNAERSVINHFIKRALKEKKLDVYGDGGPLRDYNYVENVAEAFVCAAQSEKTNGEFYILGSGQGKTFIDFLDKLKNEIKNTLGFEIEINKIPVPEAVEKTVQGDVIADYSKLKDATGWQPKISFEEGIRKTIEFYYKNE